MPAVLVVSSLTASVSEYGDAVRDTGMTSIGRIVPSPFDSNVKTRSPRRVPVRTWAVVSDPSEHRAVDGERHQGIAALQSNIADGADLDSRDRHVVARRHAAGVGELCLIPDLSRPSRPAARAQAPPQ